MAKFEMETIKPSGEATRASTIDIVPEPKSDAQCLVKVNGKKLSRSRFDRLFAPRDWFAHEGKAIGNDVLAIKVQQGMEKVWGKHNEIKDHINNLKTNFSEEIRNHQIRSSKNGLNGNGK